MALAAAASVSLLVALPASADPVDDPESSALVQRLLQRSRENKEVNDAARKDYSKQYSSYFDVLKATSSYVPTTEADRQKLGYSRPVECGLPFFAASDLCKAFDSAPSTATP